MSDHQRRRIAARPRTDEERREEQQVRESVRDRPTVRELVARGDLDPEREMTNASLHELLKVTALLKWERETRGLSLTAVARRSGLDPAVLSRLETGKNPNPTFETLSRYAAALDLDLSIGLTPHLEQPPAIDLGTLGELMTLVTALGPERARQRLLLIPEQVG
jgi:transcriptional regulator with XRE-family HTH domain